MTTSVGTAGWSYPDWKGVVYPENPGRAFDPLRYLAAHVGTIEINGTFYRPPTPAAAERWAEVVSGLEGFRFTAKLHQGFTHRPPPEWTLAEVDAFRDGLRPLVERGLLAAVLAQFPFHFDARLDHLRHLATIAKAFPDAPRVVEVRHRSFLSDENLGHLRDLGFSFCNIDQPQARTSIGPGSWVTGPIGYLRLHGRNRDAWFSKGATRDEKYDYLYRPDELEEFVRHARALEDRAEQVFVVANNHFRGKALVNALELQSALVGSRVDVPPPLLRAYPRLATIAVDAGADGIAPTGAAPRPPPGPDRQRAGGADRDAEEGP